MSAGGDLAEQRRVWPVRIFRRGGRFGCAEQRRLAPSPWSLVGRNGQRFPGAVIRQGGLADALWAGEEPGVWHAVAGERLAKVLQGLPVTEELLGESRRRGLLGRRFGFAGPRHS